MSYYDLLIAKFDNRYYIGIQLISDFSIALRLSNGLIYKFTTNFQDKEYTFEMHDDMIKILDQKKKIDFI